MSTESDDEADASSAAAHAPAPRTRLNYLVYRGLATAVQGLPEPVASTAASLSGIVMSKLAARPRPIVRANLRRVLGPAASEGELDRAVVEAFQSYADYWVESARLVRFRPPAGARAASRSRASMPVEDEMAKGRGVILALPHLGAWDFGGLWLTLKGYPMTTVVEPVEPPELFEWFRAQREMLGLTIHTLNAEAPGLLLSALRRGRLVGLVADRDIVGNGVKVEFFGEPTTLPGGAALLALRTGAPLFPCAVYQGAGRRRHAVVRPPLRDRAVRQAPARRRRDDPAARPRVRGADPAGAHAVAHVPAELAG